MANPAPVKTPPTSENADTIGQNLRQREKAVKLYRKAIKGLKLFSDLPKLAGSVIAIDERRGADALKSMSDALHIARSLTPPLEADEIFRTRGDSDE